MFKTDSDGFPVIRKYGLFPPPHPPPPPITWFNNTVTTISRDVLTIVYKPTVGGRVRVDWPDRFFVGRWKWDYADNIACRERYWRDVGI